MKASTASEDWRKKYLDGLATLESEQQQFRAMEVVLKRLAGRLCIASLGQSPQLDAEIKKLQTAVRRESTSAELEKITVALSDAITALDDSAPAPVVATQPDRNEPIVGDARIRSILAALLSELRRDPELVVQIDALDSTLATSITRDRLPELLASVAVIVAERIERIEHVKEQLELLLNHMVVKLDEIGRFVAEQNQSESHSQASNETLNAQLVDEIEAMGDSMESATDLDQIRTQVRSRLDSIGQHLQAFRQREVTLASAMHVRTEQMQARVAELEAQAKDLQGKLTDEQRLSMRDPLTDIANRLAYEKRIEEELKRWERFRQPTWIVVWDVDHFKRINDGYGHRAGDRVLRVVAERLASRMRTTDFIARYGGEEFVMILCGTQRDDAVRLIEEMRDGIFTLKFNSRGTPLAVTVSSGFTALQTGDSAAAAFDRADKALYQAKQTGRNRCVGL